MRIMEAVRAGNRKKVNHEPGVDEERNLSALELFFG
jgi:hypothetical protein